LKNSGGGEKLWRLTKILGGLEKFWRKIVAELKLAETRVGMVRMKTQTEDYYQSL
jgi:hypothetical protein